MVDEALKMTPLPKVIWMQLGARDDAAAATAEAAGLKVVMNRCPKIEYGRLSSEISWMGVNSRTLSSKRAPVPTQGMRLSLNRTSVGGGETAASDRAAKNRNDALVTQMRNDCFGNATMRSANRFELRSDASRRLDGGRRCHQHAAVANSDKAEQDARMTDRLPGFSTLAVHAGAQPDPTTGARVTPIYQTTSFVFNDADHAASLFGLQAFGNIYTRISNPTTAVLEERVAALEGGTAALAVASGHAAQVVVMQQLLMPGDEFIAARKLYGGSINQFTHAFKSFGWNVAWADPDDIGSFRRAVTPHTKAIFIESIANPGGSVTDIEAVAAVAARPACP